MSKFLEIKENFDLDVASIEGTIFETYYRNRTLTSGSSLFFYQEVDVSEIIRGLSYKQIIKGGPVTFQLLVGCTIGNVLETINGYNVDRRRFVSGDSWLALSSIRRVDSLTGGIIIDEWFSESPATGSARSTATSEEIGITGIYDSTVYPCFIVTNEGTGSVDVDLSFVWKELLLDS